MSDDARLCFDDGIPSGWSPLASDDVSGGAGVVRVAWGCRPEGIPQSSIQGCCFPPGEEGARWSDDGDDCG